MDNMENMDFETMRDKQAGELMQLLDERRMKELQLRLEDMNEFDVAEFLSEITECRWCSGSFPSRWRPTYLQISTRPSRSR